MFFEPLDRVYVDESKARGYFIAAAASAPNDNPSTNKALRALLLPGQRRLHFKGERDARRRQILAAMSKLDVRVAVWVVNGKPDKVARPQCLRGVVQAMTESGAEHLVIERDESSEAADRATIARARRQGGGEFSYRHAAPHEEPMLWVSDAVAWCFSRRGEWIPRCEPMVGQRVLRL